MRRLADEWRAAGVKTALVPTMGCLHEGHLSLVQRARRLAGRRGIVILSIFVNPAQFGPNEDFTRYPRDLDRDAAFGEKAGADVAFAPSTEEMYPAEPDQRISTYVVEEDLAGSMEGAARPTHFRGVTTIVAKLFNIVDPTWAVFGQKDFQQAAIVGRMIRDLNFRVRLVVAPTVRERDGLAMSSRNQYLSAIERSQATVLWRAIQLAGEMVERARAGVSAGALHQAMAGLIAQQPDARLDYIAFFNPATLKPMEMVTRGTQVALAVFVGKTRLIDNAKL
jgi:pantoate--beta-alanine ligase